MNLWLLSYILGTIIVLGFGVAIFAYPIILLIVVGVLLVGIVVVGLSCAIHDVVQDRRTDENLKSSK